MTESSFVEQSKVRLKEGGVAFKKGDMAGPMFVVLSGKVRLYMADKPSGEWCEELVKGDFFGESSLLESLPRETTAVAMEDTELISISRGTFMRMIRQNPEISVKMMQRLTQRNRTLAARLEMGEVGAYAYEAPEKAPRPKQEARFVSIASGHKYPVEPRGALIGRFDPATGIYPDIDLTADDAYLSVSRRHARIFFEHDRYFVVEENSVANGTFLHGKRLTPGDAHEIYNGDRISFGAVVLVFNGQT